MTKSRNLKLEKAIANYVNARTQLIKIADELDSLHGNDNLIGRIGEYYAIRYLEEVEEGKVEQNKNTSEKGYDLIHNENTRVSVKVITTENIRGRLMRLKAPWDELIFIELGEDYKPLRIGKLTYEQIKRSKKERGWSLTPVVKRSMLSENGLIGQYGCLVSKEQIKKIFYE